ncbi:MAG: serine hydrolase domain-containing protein [Dokdonella sp.]
MIRLFACIVVTLLPFAAMADPPSASTPAARAAEAWLTAFNASDGPALKAFGEKYGRDAPVDDELAFRDRTGGFTVLEADDTDPLVSELTLREKGSSTRAHLRVALDASNHSRISAFRIEPVRVDVARVSQTAALTLLTGEGNRLAEQDQFSGVVLVARNDHLLLHKAWGLADRERRRPVTLDTRFRIGSMDKMFTSIAALQLIEKGALSLEGTVGAYLPEYPSKDIAAKVTIRHLLGHAGGTGDFFGPEFDAHRESLKTHTDYIALFGARPPEFEPGSEFRYSNYGMILLGAIIERVSGQSYYDYVRERVFKPAHMDATGFEPEKTDVPHRSRGYTRTKGAWVSNASTLPLRGTAAGGGYSTAGDLLRFAKALQSNVLVSKASFDLATTPSHMSPGYGFGFEVSGEGTLHRVGHSGGAPGQNGEMRIYPDLGVVVIALSNLDPPVAGRLVNYYESCMPVPAGLSPGRQHILEHDGSNSPAHSDRSIQREQPPARAAAEPPSA